jgi:oligopeptide/dipeptide ABC transporter ATP-binding protein
MYVGRIYELAPTEQLFIHPLCPYTRTLLSSVPVISEQERGIKPAKQSIGGDVPSPVNPPDGCAFHPRCKLADDICRKRLPELEEVLPGHFVRCHHVRLNMPSDQTTI